MIALRDVCGLDPKAEREVLTWAARVLVNATLNETASQAQGPKRPAR